MTPAELRKRLHSDETSFGTLIVSPSPRWPEAVRGCGLDFVFIDTEHIALDRAQLSWMCQTYAALGCRRWCAFRRPTRTLPPWCSMAARRG